jgi:hypothetical protein
MRILFSVPLWVGFFASSLAGITIDFQVSNLGSNVYRYTYLVSGFSFLTNQELDIRFNPALYGTLSNGVAGSGFNLVLLQPNNPPGAFGDYSALALVDNPSLAGPFRVDVTFLGSGQPGSQPFLVNQFDANHNLIGTIATGVTGIPEPVTFWLGGLGVLMMLARRRSGNHVFGKRLFRRNGKQEDAFEFR